MASADVRPFILSILFSPVCRCRRWPGRGAQLSGGARFLICPQFAAPAFARSE